MSVKKKPGVVRRFAGHEPRYAALNTGDLRSSKFPGLRGASKDLIFCMRIKNFIFDATVTKVWY
ncbi:hypothetical protein AmDm5_0265 [Acetobacter malorum]|nr:hypothetical protein AmDm5_0265 [Acetobacter malorum]